MVSIESVSVACFCALCECIFVVGGQFLYGGCICAYTMRECIPLWVCPLSCSGVCGRWSVPLWWVYLCLYHEREHPSVVVGVDGSV